MASDKVWGKAIYGLVLGASIASGAQAQEADPPAAPAVPESSAEVSATPAPADDPPLAPPAPAEQTPGQTGQLSAPAPLGSEPAAVDGAAGWGDLSDLQQESEDAPVFRTKVYGFIDYHAEKVANTPDSVNDSGRTVYAENPWELDVLSANVMVQGSIYDKYRFFINLAAPSAGSNVEDASIDLRNAWVEAPVVSRYVIVRAGKLYRRFGLYNEILDAVPTFIGIEAPELFDKDHLLLTRTTNLMVHGSVDVGPGVLNYAVTTGQDERAGESLPIGGDLNVELPFGLKLGSSFYTTGGDAAASRAVGEGSPRGGVVNWMAEDRYVVFGGYAQLKNSGFILQAEFWRAQHDGTRSVDALTALADDGSLSPAQRRRFFVGGDPAAGTRTEAEYSINTGYFRGGYEIALGQLASVTPYVQFDYYSNPETVKNKDLGGNDEAGLSDDGQFNKYTVGAVFRPVTQVALKIDGSAHQQEFNDKSEFYPEVRTSISYLWELNP